jgi:capsular polysaccharide transport system permease protein
MTADTGPPFPAQGRTPRLQFARVFVALVLREMTTRYSRAAGGYLWAVLGPVLAISLMSVVFSLMFRSPSLGTSFIMFYSSAYVPFHVYLDVQASVAGAVRFNRALMQYPAVTPVDAMLARATLSFLTVTLTGAAILTGAVLVSSTPVNLDFLIMAKAVSSAAVLGFGIGAVNCVVMAFFPTWERIWRIVTAPLFICSAVIYIYEEIPRAFQPILALNPLVHVTASMRTGIFGAYRPDFISLPYVWTIGIALSVIGLHLARRHRSVLINPRF